MIYEKHVSSFMVAHPDAPVEIVEKVNREIDQFAHYPNMETLTRHRKFLHHQEGIEYFGLVYGQWGAKAAREHILQDLGHIPAMVDYHLGDLDEFGYFRAPRA